MGFISKILRKVDETAGKKLAEKVGYPAFVAGEKMKTKSRISALERSKKSLMKLPQTEEVSRQIEEINKELEEKRKLLEVYSKHNSE